MEQCIECNSQNISKTNVFHTIQYGIDNVVGIPVTLPVYNCMDCNFQWYDYEGEEAIDKAVSDYRKTL